MSVKLFVFVFALFCSTPLWAEKCPGCNPKLTRINAVTSDNSVEPEKAKQIERRFSEMELDYVCTILAKDSSAKEIIIFAQDGLVPLMKQHICIDDLMWGGKRNVLETAFIGIHNHMNRVIDFLNYFKDHKMFDEMEEILNTRDQDGRTTLDYLDFVKNKLTVAENKARLEKVAFYLCAFRGRYSDPEKNKNCRSRY